MIALLILVLFGMLGLAIDSGRAYVDRRDQQAAVDAAALAAGDWYENYNDLYGIHTCPTPRRSTQTNLHLYGGATSDSDTTVFIGPNSALQQDTDVVTYAGGYTLTIVATNTQFNGYQFVFTSTHNLPLAFMQIFGGSPNVTINATATAIVGNQRQTPALLTLSNQACATQLQGAGSSDRARRRLHERHRVPGLQPARGRQLLRRCRLELQRRALLLLQLDARLHPVPAAVQPPVTRRAVRSCRRRRCPTPVTWPLPCRTTPRPAATFDRGGYTEMTPGPYNGFSDQRRRLLLPRRRRLHVERRLHLSRRLVFQRAEGAERGEVQRARARPSRAATDFWGGCAGTFNVSVVAAAAPNQA